MSIAKIKKNLERGVECDVVRKLAKTTSSETGMNPLRKHKMTSWLKKSATHANINYITTFDRKK